MIIPNSIQTAIVIFIAAAVAVGAGLSKLSTMRKRAAEVAAVRAEYEAREESYKKALDALQRAAAANQAALVRSQEGRRRAQEALEASRQGLGSSLAANAPWAASQVPPDVAAAILKTHPEAP